NQRVDPDEAKLTGKALEGVVDLRSDTVTRPTAEMRQAMATAEVGDDVYGEDPTVNKLEKRAAEIFGKEAALFVPTGCMGNLISVKIWTHHGSEVICEERSHVNLYELASMSAIAGCMPRVVRGEDGILTWEEIKAAIRPKIYYDSQTALIALENTSNMAGGTVYPTDRVNEICDRAHDMGLKVHLDGARIFNAATALGDHVAVMAKKVDSVMFCLSKGLGAPVGSMVAGSKAFIEKARIYRKMFGGGMRQAGVIAAAGLIALEKSPARLHVDHENAKLLAEGINCGPVVSLLDAQKASREQTPPASNESNKARPTAEEAKKYIENAETELFNLGVKASRASWVEENFITDDTEKIAADANEV